MLIDSKTVLFEIIKEIFVMFNELMMINILDIKIIDMIALINIFKMMAYQLIMI